MTRVVSRTVSGSFSLLASTCSLGGEGSKRPRWWGLVARAIEEARRKVTTDRAVVGGGKDRVPGD